MNLTYKDDELRQLAQGEDVKTKFSRAVLVQYRRKIAMLRAIDDERNLHTVHGLGYEKLKRDREGEHAIRVTGKYRICFEIHKGENGNTLHITYFGDYH